jgi:RHS repeat-associated protein
VTSYRLEGAPEPAARFAYDPFGRTRESERGSKLEKFSYDGLDRRDTREVGARFFDLSYVGLSEALSQESQFEGGDERRSYDYTSALERVGTARKADGVSDDARYRAYSLDANGSVEGLQDDTGVDSDDRYRYDPYGQALDSEGDPQDEDALSPDQQANPFRFQGHYYDAAFETYDMKARAYLPEVGRFLQEDHYEQASGDQALETDPLTQDRYAFAAANPIDNIEFDGHKATTGGRDSTSQSLMVYKGKPIRNRSYSPETVFPQRRTYLEHRASGDAPLTDATGGYEQSRAVAPPKDTSLGARCLADAARGGCAAWGELDDYASSQSGGGPSLGGAIHLGLDLAGAVPALGEPFDLANCGIYAAEGEPGDAALSCGAAIPFAGWAATGTKAGRRIAAMGGARPVRVGQRGRRRPGSRRTPRRSRQRSTRTDREFPMRSTLKRVFSVRSRTSVTSPTQVSSATTPRSPSVRATRSN